MLKVNYINEIKKVLDFSGKNTYNTQFENLEESKIFDNFYKEFIKYFEFQLNNILSEFSNEQFNINVDKILLNCMESFRNDMIGICNKILISEIYKMKEKGELVGKTKVDRYSYFNNLLDGKMKLKIIEENPVLDYLIINKINTKLAHIKECLIRLKKDFIEITDKFDIDIKLINKLLLDEGDTHNNGKSVIILEFDKGIKIVYKPHSMDSDESFNRLVDYINKSNYFKYDLKTANSINKNDYGWQEFITYKECESKEEVKAYFFRIGMLIAVFNLIRSKDFHYENIVAHGGYPVPIDVETIISNRENTLDNEKCLNLISRNFAMEVENSIYGTLMIPQNLEMINFPIDMSGLNGGLNSENDIELSKIINVGTDEIGYQKIKANIDEKQNRVKYKGNLIEIKDYISYIIVGLDKGYEFIIGKREELIDLIKNNKIFKGKYRQVLRATAKYVKFLDAAIHPLYTSKFENRNKIFSYLFGHSKISNKLRKRIESEISQLYVNDVPYFWTEFNSKDIYGADGTCIPRYYDKTMCELIIDRIKLADQMDKQKQILYLKSSIASLIKIQDSNKYKENYSSVILNDFKVSNDKKIKYIEISKKIADYLQNLCIWNSKKDKCTFMALNAQNDGAIKYGSLNRNLYEGLGIVLFFATLYKETKGSSYKKIIDGILNGYDEIYMDSISEIKSSGVFTGIGSLIYIYYNLWVIFKEKKFYDKYRKCLEKILKLDFTEREFDVIHGAAGLSILLSNIYLKERDSFILDLMNKCGEKLYFELKDKSKKHLTGFSHGYAGYSTALFVLAYYLNNDKYYKLAKSLINIENKYIDFKRNNWMDLRSNTNLADPVYWCHGAAGITLARILAKQYLKKEDKKILDNNIEMGLNKILKDGFDSNKNDSICHGIFGNLDCILVIAKKNHDKSLLKIIYNIADKECEAMVKNGIKCANPLKVETINFMLGISGIGYELLRLYNNNIPSVLALEVF
ncbi:type 2 lanthipeptide synthetase LanM [Clostridium oceanicum]|uniref:Type 2 lanthipeptide synthetase LanM family protein n=1 Tax=Clostridium oceanicum TaxID=1543 RepID=A0ABN1JY40_9CLOT